MIHIQDRVTECRTRVSPSKCAPSRPLIWVLCREGCMLNRLATKAKLSLLFPDVTSWGETNCLQSSRAACRSISSALWSKLCSFTCTWNTLQTLCTYNPDRISHSKKPLKRHPVTFMCYTNKLTHVEAAHVNFDPHFEVTLFMLSNLVQQVEVGSRVL